MAVTRIHPIKATVQKAVDYIINPDKTDEHVFVDSFLCAPEIAEQTFKFYNSKTNERINSNPAYHLIQSFFPGEISYEEAHKIGIEFADKVLKNNHAYVVSTHIDKGHVHNHIIFCSANVHDSSRYNSSHENLELIQKINDEICSEHGLSIVKEKKDIGRNYLEWKSIKNGTSWKEHIRNDIDETIDQSQDYDSFIRIMREKGYEITGEQLSADSRKYITFKAPGMKKSARGKEKSLGINYTKENIYKRIHSRYRSYPQMDETAPTIINTNREKFQNNIGLMRWAEKKNLKSASTLYSQIGSINELRKQIELKEKYTFSHKDIVNKYDERLKDLTEIMTYVDAYQSNLVYQTRYDRSADPERYYKNHQPQLEIFRTAKAFLEMNGIDVDRTDFGRLSREYESLKKDKEKAEKEFAKNQKDLNKLRAMEKDLNQYMKNEGRNPSRDAHNKAADRLSHGDKGKGITI